MIVQYWWRDCEYRNKQWDSKPANAFWVEALLEEAEAQIFPQLSSDAITESKLLAEKSKEILSDLDGVSHPYCFLVAQDLSSVDPFHASYPFHQMWNGYSPFRPYPKRLICSLEQLKTLELPDETVENDIIT